MGHDFRVRSLLQEIMDSKVTPEEACRHCPDLLPEVVSRLRDIHLLNADFEVLFPSGDRNGIWSPSASGQKPADFATPRIDGYDIQAMLGFGGMGVVYKAWHRKLERPVAIKVLRAGVHSQAHDFATLLREAQAVAGLRHPHIVQVHDVSEIDGLPYFTMEFIEGGSLAQKFGGCPQPPRDAAALLSTLADAVEAAHQGAIVHRDLKPSNILLTATGAPKITDFGLARRVKESSEITLTAARGGTPCYMAPEQALGTAEAFDPPVDIYALGAILYEGLTGRPPFRGETPQETQRKLIGEEPVSPSRLNRDVPRDLEVICLKCLSKDPKRRYTGAALLADDLKRFLAGEPILARPAALGERVEKWIRRHRAQTGVIAATAAALIILVGSVAWIGWERASTNRAAADDLNRAVEFERGADWNSARTALERAKGRLGSGGSQELRQRATEVEADLAFVAMLDKIRFGRIRMAGARGNLFNEQASREYQTAFQESGFVPVFGGADDCVERIRRSNIREAVVAGLDDWSVCDPAKSEWIFGLTSALDNDVWRTLIRNPAVQADKARLEQLAAEAPVGTQPVRPLLAFATRLRQAGVRPLNLLRAVQQEHPDDFWANFELGFELLESKSPDSVRYLTAATAIRPESPSAQYNLGNALLRFQKPEEAIPHFARVLELFPDHEYSHNNIAVAYIQTNQIDKAIDHLRESLRLAPDSISSHGNLGGLLATKGLFDEAANEFREAIRLNPKVPQLYNNLANVSDRAGNAAAAAENYEAALKLDPNFPGAHLNYAEFLEAHGRPQEAAEHFRRLIALQPENHTFRNQLREMLVRLGKADLARAEWQELLASDPPEFEAWDGYLELCLFVGARAEYQRACRALLSRFDDTTDIRVAERVARACLLAPRNSEERQRAEAMIDRARASNLSPKDPAMNASLAFAKALAEYRGDRFDHAVALLNGDAASFPNPSRAILLALAKWRLGQESEALSGFAHGISESDWKPERAGNSDAWVNHVLRREAEQLILTNLALFRENRYWPENNDERLAMQGTCQAEDLAATSTRIYTDAFEADPKLASGWPSDIRWFAARAAALAGSGIGADAEPVHPEQRAEFRRLARRWLNEDLESMREAVDLGKDCDDVKQTLNRWMFDEDLACIRSQLALEQLPQAERAEFESLWETVGSLEARARKTISASQAEKTTFQIAPGSPVKGTR